MTHRSFSFSPIRKRALVSSLPVMMGYIAMGFAAGVLLSTRSGVEYPALWGIFTAMTSISGTLQFLFPEWFRKGLPLAEVALLTLCINFRYAMYGFSLLEKFKGLPWWKRCYLIWTLTDETYALEVAAPYPAGKDHTLYCFTLAMLDHCYWIIGVALGAVAGSHLPFSVPLQCQGRQRIPSRTAVGMGGADGNINAELAAHIIGVEDSRHRKGSETAPLEGSYVGHAFRQMQYAQPRIIFEP